MQNINVKKIIDQELILLCHIMKKIKNIKIKKKELFIIIYFSLKYISTFDANSRAIDLA